MGVQEGLGAWQVGVARADGTDHRPRAPTCPVRLFSTRHVKALYRRAKALAGLGRASDATAAAATTPPAAPASADAAVLLRQHMASCLRGKGVGGGLNALPPPSTPPPAWVDGVHVPPPAADPSTNLLVLLHGAGDSPTPFARLATALALPATAGLALRAPLRVGVEGGLWFCAGALGPTDAASLEAHAPALLARLDGTGWPRGRTHVFGYGDGGVAALHAVLRAARAGEEPFGSCVAVSAALPDEVVRGGAGDGAGKGAAPPAPGTPPLGTPTLITRGERDAALQPSAVEATVAALERAGCAARLFTVPGKAGGMLAGPAEARAAMELWAAHLARPPPAPGFVEVGRG